MSRVGLTPGEPTLTDEGLDEKDADLSFLVWKDRRLVPSGELRRRDASGQTGEGVVRILHPEELLGPRQGITGSNELLILVLIDSLSMAEVHITPGWQARWDECPHWKIWRDKQIVGPHYLVLSSPGDHPNDIGR